jgi:hypothetical protein
VATKFCEMQQSRSDEPDCEELSFGVLTMHASSIGYAWHLSGESAARSRRETILITVNNRTAPASKPQLLALMAVTPNG